MSDHSGAHGHDKHAHGNQRHHFRNAVFCFAVASAVFVAPNVMTGPEPVTTSVRMEEVLPRGQRERPEAEEDDDELGTHPHAVLDLLTTHYDLDAAEHSAEALDAWEDGLTDPKIYPAFRHLLRSVEEAALAEAGASLSQLDLQARNTMNAIVLTAVTPTEAAQLIAGNTAGSNVWESLVRIARGGADLQHEPADSAGQVSQSSPRDLDVLEEVAESQRALAEVLEQSLSQSQTSGRDESGWGKTLGMLTFPALAGHLLGTYIEAASKGAVELTKRAIRHVAAQSEGKPAAAQTPEDHVQASLEIAGALAYARTAMLLDPGSGADRRAVAEIPAQVLTVEPLVKQLLSLGIQHDLSPDLMGQIRAVVQEGVKTAFKQHAPAPSAAVVAAASNAYDGLIDRVL
jgi:hypothetical protein